MWTEDFSTEDIQRSHITNCDVDDDYGSYTAEQTAFWESINGFPQDGIVGVKMWSLADNSLKADGTLVAFRGSYESQYYTRQDDSPHHYHWTWHNSPYYYTGDTGVQIAVYR